MPNMPMPEISGALCAVCVALYVIASHRKVGGLHFIKLGRVGISFWIRKHTNA